MVNTPNEWVECEIADIPILAVNCWFGADLRNLKDWFERHPLTVKYIGNAIRNKSVFCGLKTFYNAFTSGSRREGGGGAWIIKGDYSIK